MKDINTYDQIVLLSNGDFIIDMLFDEKEVEIVRDHVTSNLDSFSYDDIHDLYKLCEHGIFRQILKELLLEIENHHFLLSVYNVMRDDFYFDIETFSSIVNKLVINNDDFYSAIQNGVYFYDSKPPIPLKVIMEGSEDLYNQIIEQAKENKKTDKKWNKIHKQEKEKELLRKLKRKYPEE